MRLGFAALPLGKWSRFENGATMKKGGRSLPLDWVHTTAAVFGNSRSRHAVRLEPVKCPFEAIFGGLHAITRPIVRMKGMRRILVNHKL